EALYYGDSTWTEETVPPFVRSIVERAAKRVYENPDNVTQESENLGQYGRSVQRRGLDDVGDILTASERKRIARIAGRAAGAFSVRTPSAYYDECAEADTEASFG